MSAIPPFTYRSDPVRIVFGAGSVASLRAETDLHKISRLLVLCSKTRVEFAKHVTAPVADRIVGLCGAAGQSMPRDAFERILADIKQHNADGFIVVGGGSPIGLAKAAAGTELGFLQRLRGDQEMFEVRRILKAYVDGQWLADLDARLAEYLGEADSDVGQTESPDATEVT